MPSGYLKDGTKRIPPSRKGKSWASKGKTGHKQSDEHRRKISLSKFGHSVSEETKLKIRNKTKGRKAWNKGKQFPEETRRKMSQSRMNNPKFMGENHPNWKGGISFEEYSLSWNETLRRSIRERDKYTCRICMKQQGDKAHDVHHIDYDKKNCNPTNLITLCHSCHTKTNHNREHWIKVFTQTSY